MSAPVVGSVTENDGVIEIRRDSSTTVLNFTGRPTPIPAGEIVWSTSDLVYRAEGEDEELAEGALLPWSATIVG